MLLLEGSFLECPFTQRSFPPSPTNEHRDQTARDKFHGYFVMDPSIDWELRWCLRNEAILCDFEKLSYCNMRRLIGAHGYCPHLFRFTQAPAYRHLLVPHWFPLLVSSSALAELLALSLSVITPTRPYPPLLSAVSLRKAAASSPSSIISL